MRKVTATLLGLSLFVAPSLASASDPLGIVASPRAMDFYPNEAAATEVVIRGNFSFNKGSAPPSYDYSAPVCGYMYFKCPVGKEVECRMQWAEIKSAIDNCRGFGTYSKVPTATIRPTGTALSSPDPYDLGMGTMAVGGIGNCAAMKTAKCEVTIPSSGDAGPPVDAGAPDTGSAIDSGTKADASPPADTSVTPTDTGSPPADTGGVVPPADTGSTPPADTGSSAADTGTAPIAPGTDDGGGCSVGTVGGAAPFGAMGLALAAFGLLRRRRPRR